MLMERITCWDLYKLKIISLCKRFQTIRAWFNFQPCGLICFWESGVREMNPNTWKEFSPAFPCYALSPLVLVRANSTFSRQTPAASYSWFGLGFFYDCFADLSHLSISVYYRIFSHFAHFRSSQ